MDVAMPEMDGLEATNRIRALPGPKGAIPIIAMTAFAMQSDADLCLSAGMNSYLSKPINPTLLLSEVARWIGRAPISRDIPESTANEGAILDEMAITTLEEGTDRETVRLIAGKVAAEICSRAGRLVEAAERGDTIAAGREAHTIKGLAATFGTMALTAIAQSVEDGCRAGHLDVLTQVDSLRLAAYKAADALRERFDLGTIDHPSVRGPI